MIVELGIGVLLATAAYQASRPKKGVMTPTMRAIFTHAVNKRNPPVPPTELLKLADIFDTGQLPAYSEILRKRAALALRSPELKARHRSAYRKAMASVDPLRVRVAATAFESMGMTGCAANLRNLAATLDQASLASAVGAAAAMRAPAPEPDPISGPDDTGDVPVPQAQPSVPSDASTASLASTGDAFSDAVGTQDNLASAEIDAALAGGSVGDESGVDPDNQDLDDFTTFGTNGPNGTDATQPPGSVVAAAAAPSGGGAEGAGGTIVDTPDGAVAAPAGVSPEAINAGFQSDAEYHEFMGGQAAQ